MKTSNETVELDNMKAKLHELVHTYIREYDARNAEITVIEERFKEYSMFVDRLARRSFKYLTISMIKCSYGFNHYATRDMMINKYGGDKCL